MPETDTQSSFMIPSGVLVVRYYLPKSYILPLDKRHFISVTSIFRIGQLYFKLLSINVQSIFINRIYHIIDYIL